LVEALRGRIAEHHRILLKLNLELIEALGEALHKVDPARDRTRADRGARQDPDDDVWGQ
jgi:hypothetical protein